MPTTFEALAELCERLEATKKRLVTVGLTADFLKTLYAEEVEPAVSMILGRPFPKWSQVALEVSWATLIDAIRQITSADEAVFEQAFGESVDVGSATKAIFEKSRGRKQMSLVDRTLTVLEVRRDFELIAEAVGSGSRQKKERLIRALLSQASPVEAKYLVKIFIGEMRTGFHEGLMEQAVSKAFEVPLSQVQTASMTVGDIGEVAAIVRRSGVAGLSKVHFRAFRPVSLMLASMADGVADALNEHGGTSAFESKYDGARVQIHKLGHDVRIFSRRLTDVTESLPEISDLVREKVTANEAILEGEAVAVDSRGVPVPFQHLMRRFRRVREIEDTAERIPIRLYLFDVLFLEGESLIMLPYVERRQKLSRIVDGLELAGQLVTGSVDAAEKFLKLAMDAGHEGLMAKKPDSPYTPGVRGKRWLKIKPVLEPLDLIIVAAEWGYGRRHGWLSDYYLAARDEKSGELWELGKTFKGLTDQEIIEMTRRLKELTVNETPRRVVVAPKIVVEVLYNEIQKSPKYKGGMALRFARISRIRDDKTADQADTIQKVREIYESQFLKKGRYKTE
jgi:DNA ligase-1